MKKIMFCIGLASFLSACTPADQDAQKLGFANADEMQKIQSQGYKTKNEWNIYQAKILGFSNVAEMKKIQSQGFKTKAEWNHKQLVIEDMRFLVPHGFDTIAEFKKFKSSNSDQQLKISIKNSSKVISYDKYVECWGKHEALMAFLRVKNIKLDVYMRAVSGIYLLVREEYIAQGMKPEKIDGDVRKIIRASIKAYDLTDLHDSISVCGTLYTPFTNPDKIASYQLKSEMPIGSINNKKS